MITTAQVSTETISSFDSSAKSLLRIKWSVEKIARMLSSKDSLGKEGVTYTWAFSRISCVA